MLAQHPRVFLRDEFAPPEQLERVVSIASDRALLERHAHSYERDSCSFTAELAHASEPVLAELAERMSASIGLGPGLGETLRLRAYGEGDRHGLHLDSYTDEDSGHTLVATAMLYLCDTEAGGATHFPAARPGPLWVMPRAGRVLLWFSHREDGSLDRSSLHEGCAVESGYKLVLNAFCYRPLSACAAIPGLAICAQARS